MMKSIKVLIIDDEEKVRATLKKLLEKFCPQLNLCAMASSADEAYKMIIAHQPELIFLDIEMPGENGFELLKRFDKIDFSTIFVTAYDQYALNAIKFSALDYILKPVHSQDLVEAVNKFEKNQSNSEGLEQLLLNLTEKKGFQKIAIPSISKIQYVDLDEIIYLEADGSYTQIYQKGDQVILSTRSLKEYEEMINGGNFFRINRSYMVNLIHVKEYIKSEMDTLLLSDGSSIKFSRKRRNNFFTAMENNPDLRTISG